MKKKKLKQRHPYSTGRRDLDRRIKELVEAAGGSENEHLIYEMMVTALRIREDNMDRGVLRLMNAAMKELRYAFSVFQHYKHIRKVAIFGSARTPRTSPDYKQTRDFARKIVKQGWMVITGASSGIMSAGNEGAGRAHSFGVNIRLPFEQDANPTIKDDPKLINFKYFFTRKLIFVAGSDATVLCPGGFGTHDEGFETLTLIQTGKTDPRPVVCLDPPGSKYWSAWRNYLKIHLGRKKMIDRDDLDLIYFTHSEEKAVQHILDFYRIYHSLRYVRDKLVLRLKEPLSEKQVARLNRSFSDMLVRGKMVLQLNPFPDEENEPHTLDMPRLVFQFNRRHFARLSTLIRTINKGI